MTLGNLVALDLPRGPDPLAEPFAFFDDFHRTLVSAVRAHYPINRAPPELVGTLHFLEDQWRALRQRYVDALAQELPPL